LAAALVTLSFWRAERPLLDPFCGSGTIPIEAAMIGRNIAPGSLRSFASESWPNITTQVWQAAREEARDLVREPFEERLVGTDIDKRVLQYARANAERAGVADLIHFQDRDFRDLSSKRQYGCVITNPPYGERMGDHREHAPLYGSMPEVLRRLPTWSHFVFTSYPGFEQLVQLKQDIHCFRLYERDVPEIPLVVDRLEDHLHITEYERPHDRDRAQHADWLDLMCRAAGEALDVAKTKIVIKRRQRQRGSLQHDRLSDVGHELEVREGGLRFVLNLSDYVDTGLFLDHRITRSMVRDEVLKRRFLNLFAYTGSFTVYAADGAASHTTTVDTSRTYLNWAKRNLALNRLDGVQHEFVRNEARQYLRETPETVKFDVVVADAPTFSNRKGEENDWTVQDHHVELLQLIGTHLDGGGIVYFSTNFRRFKLDEAALVEYSIREISAQTVPPDFRNRRIHRCWRMCKVE
jgi:23S rRNA (cytosine1962-C5)-methyltransferase